MWILNYIKAPKDVNGNPRRGWHAILKDDGTQVWIEEGNRGTAAITDWMDTDWFREFADFNIYHAGEYAVSVAQRRLIRKSAERIF